MSNKIPNIKTQRIISRLNLKSWFLINKINTRKWIQSKSNGMVKNKSEGCLKSN